MSSEIYYNIEKILDRKKIKERQFYKIKWEGYPMDQCTWEPIENLQNAIALIEEYNKAHPIKAKKEKKTKNLTMIGKKRKDKEIQKTQEAIIMHQIQSNNIPNNINNNYIEQNKSCMNENNLFQNQNVMNENNAIQNKNVVNENNTILTYNIDNSLKNVVTVKKQNDKLMAVVDKEQENGEMVKAYLTTEDLRKSNPWILLDFYESKIKFT